MDEMLKLLTIKNPRELVIFLENIEPDQISDDDLITGLHLFNYNYKIIREAVLEQTHKPRYQLAILDNVYIKHRGMMDILQQLGLDGAEHYYSRIALILLIEFILKHDRTIIQKLEMPEIIINSDNYLMLANNCLEQLDIIDNILVISSKQDKQPNYTFPCTNDIDNICEYTIKEYKISNRLSIIIRYDLDSNSEETIKTLYVEYKHSQNVDTDKINEQINRIFSKILSD
jgi:hypothetical protein